MKKLLAVMAILLVAAFLFGCAQKAEEKPPGGQPAEQPKITTPVEDIAADELAKGIPTGEENFTELDEILINLTH